MFRRTKIAVNSAGSISPSELREEKLRRIQALARHHEAVGLPVVVKDHGLRVQVNEHAYDFVFGDADPRVMTIQRSDVVQGAAADLMDLASEVTESSFAAKALVGPHPLGHSVTFVAEIFVPDLESFYQVVTLYTAALDRCRVDFLERAAAA